MNNFCCEKCKKELISVQKDTFLFENTESGVIIHFSIEKVNKNKSEATISVVCRNCKYIGHFQITH